jgi:hypothetical protein
MSDPAPCTRHARTVWIAYCPACTAWHLATKLARREGSDTLPGPRSARASPLRGPSTVPIHAISDLAA